MWSCAAHDGRSGRAPLLCKGASRFFSTKNPQIHPHTAKPKGWAKFPRQRSPSTVCDGVCKYAHMDGGCTYWGAQRVRVSTDKRSPQLVTIAGAGGVRSRTATQQMLSRLSRLSGLSTPLVAIRPATPATRRMSYLLDFTDRWGGGGQTSVQGQVCLGSLKSRSS